MSVCVFYMLKTNSSNVFLVKKQAFLHGKVLGKMESELPNLQKLSESCIFLNLEETYLLRDLQQG